jgi:hypothetical protein
MSGRRKNRLATIREKPLTPDALTAMVRRVLDGS